MSIANRIVELQELWKMLAPDVPVPPPASILRWCNYPDAAIHRGIMRAARKFAPGATEGAPDPEHIGKYVNGVARNETERLKTKSREIVAVQEESHVEINFNR